MIVSARTVAAWIDAPLSGKGDTQISDVAPLSEAGALDLAYVDKPEAIAEAASSAAGCLLVPTSADCTPLGDRTLIRVESPKAIFIDLMLKFRPPRERPAPKVTIDAWIHPTARIGEETSIGAHCFVDAEARIGERCIIHPGVYIGAGVRIGDDCEIHPNTVIQADCRLRDRVILHPCSVIGADGFGYDFTDGHFQKIPHTGTVILEDDVEIGASTCVDRAMIGQTVIGEGTKIDNQVQVAHNCRIGKHNVVAGHVGLAGSVTTGDYVQVAGQVGVADHVHVGSGSQLGAKAAVAQNVPEKSVMHGIPARPAREQIRIVTAAAKLPEMRKQLKALQNQVDRLSQALETSEQKAA